MAAVLRVPHGIIDRAGGRQDVDGVRFSFQALTQIKPTFCALIEVELRTIIAPISLKRKTHTDRICKPEQRPFPLGALVDDRDRKSVV